MIKQFFTFLILAAISLSLPAQTIKTGVLVIGNNAASVAASIQSARSGATTVLLTQSPALSLELDAEGLSSLEKIRNHYRLKDGNQVDSTNTAFNYDMSREQYTDLIKSITDTTKNLSITLDAKISRIEKDGKGWEIRLSNGQRIKADVLVDANSDLSIASLLNIDATKTLTGRADPSAIFDSKLYRSTVAVGHTRNGGLLAVTLLSLGSFIPEGVENFIIVPENTAAFQTLPMTAGQAAGTIASYCAFFKTTTKNINVRVVQGELFAFDAELIPLADISRNDPNFAAFQRMAVSGLLKPVIYQDGGKQAIRFDTTGTVSAKELSAPMKEFYSRSQIWFADNPKDTLTIGDAISLFMFTATRGEELKKEIENGWKESFNFNSSFDAERPITRKEFAILADRYLQPFNVRIGFAGNLLS